MSFVIYDITFLILFVLVGFIFLHKHRSKLKREGLLYLYRTSIGLKIIDSTATKFKKTLYYSQYLIIACGYVLMGLMIWALAKFSWLYMTSPIAAKALRIPVLTPLFPYVDRLFGNGLLPPFYFTYWIIAIAVIAISHEFAHGIIARLNKIKVHSTGFGFLGPFLAAFVEPDEKQMQKSKIFPQLSILAAGTFANIVMTVLFTIVIFIFFSLAFVPAGVYFNSYSMSLVNNSQITEVNGFILNNSAGILEQIGNLNQSVTTIKADNQTYFTTPLFISYSIENNLSQIVAYDNSPAFNSNLSGAISEINGVKITSYNILNSTLHNYKPGDNIIVKTQDVNGEKEYNLTLSSKNNQPFLGIGISPAKSNGVLGWIFNFISKIKDPGIYYISEMGDFGIFIYNLLWWIIFINLGVALTNMLPVGIFDGGRFFYLTILAITKKEKVASAAFKISTWIILLLVLVLMLKWVTIFF